MAETQHRARFVFSSLFLVSLEGAGSATEGIAEGCGEGFRLFEPDALSTSRKRALGRRSTMAAAYCLSTVEASTAPPKPVNPRPPVMGTLLALVFAPTAAGRSSLRKSCAAGCCRCLCRADAAPRPRDAAPLPQSLSWPSMAFEVPPSLHGLLRQGRRQIENRVPRWSELHVPPMVEPEHELSLSIEMERERETWRLDVRPWPF